MGGNYGDRNDLNLWNKGDALIQGVATVCKNVVSRRPIYLFLGLSSRIRKIVVVHTVGPVTMDSWIANPNVKAVLLAGLPGEQTGPAIVDVIWGAVK